METINGIKRYTKSQRLAIYKHALKAIKTDIENPTGTMGGLCFYINESMEQLVGNNVKWHSEPYIRFNDDEVAETTYPEVMPFKPQKIDMELWGFWFDKFKSEGAMRRVQILEDIISAMQKKAKKDVTFKIVFTYK